MKWDTTTEGTPPSGCLPIAFINVGRELLINAYFPMIKLYKFITYSGFEVSRRSFTSNGHIARLQYFSQTDKEKVPGARHGFFQSPAQCFTLSQAGRVQSGFFQSLALGGQSSTDGVGRGVRKTCKGASGLIFPIFCKQVFPTNEVG